MAENTFKYTNVASNYENMKKILGDVSNADSIAGILHNIDEDMKANVEVVDMAIYGDLGKQLLLNWENTSSTFGSFINNFDNWNKSVAVAAGNYAEFEQKVAEMRTANPLGMTSGGITEAYTTTGYYSSYDQELVDTAASYIGPFVAYNGIGYFDTGSVAFEEQRKTNAKWAFGLNAVSTVLSVIGLKGIGGAASAVDDVGRVALTGGDDVLRLTAGAGDDGLRLLTSGGDDALSVVTSSGDDGLRLLASGSDETALALTTGATPSSGASSFVIKGANGQIVAFGPGVSDDVLLAASKTGANSGTIIDDVVDDVVEDAVKSAGGFDVIGADGAYIGSFNANGRYSPLKTFINKTRNAGTAATDWIRTHGSQAGQWAKDTASTLGASIKTNAGKIPGYISNAAQNVGSTTTTILKNAAGTPGTGTIISSYIPRVLEENVLSDDAIANTIVSQSVYTSSAGTEE